MKTESNPTSSARHAKSRSGPGANCSAEALYPSLINAAPRHAAFRWRLTAHSGAFGASRADILTSLARQCASLDHLHDEDGFCFGNVKRGATDESASLA